MCVAIPDGDRRLVAGFVADIRRAKVERFDLAPPADMPTDQDFLNDWEADVKAAAPIAAIAYADKEAENGIATTGDKRFAAAAVHLAELADVLAKKKQQQAAKKSKKLAKSKGKTKDTVEQKRPLDSLKTWLGL